jgi:hypothetical protein
MLKIKYPFFLQCCQYAEHDIQRLICLENLAYGKSNFSQSTIDELLSIGDAEVVYYKILDLAKIKPISAVVPKKKKIIKEIMIDNYIIANYPSNRIVQASKDLSLKILLKKICLKNISLENNNIVSIDTPAE